MNGIVSEVQGRVTRDPELRYTAQGVAMLVLNLAVNDDRRAEDGPTEWVRATAWGELAERLQDRLSKGSEVYCHGRLRLRTWQKQDGKQGAGVELSAWTVQPMGVGRPRPRQDGQHEPARLRESREPARMGQMAAAVGNGRRLLDDDADLEAVPF